MVKCRECGENFEKKATLKKHISEFHPKTLKCDKCHETFDQIWTLASHAKTHTDEKRHKCNICEKDFLLQLRPKKHIKRHEQKLLSFVTFFNNKQICRFENKQGSRKLGLL